MVPLQELNRAVPIEGIARLARRHSDRLALDRYRLAIVAPACDGFENEYQWQRLSSAL
jgi:hypothetical protein